MIESLNPLIQLIFQLFYLPKVEKDDSVAEGKISEILEELNPQVQKLSEEDRRKVDVSYPLKFDSYKRFLSPSFRHDLSYDPRAVLMKVKCPVLAIIGEKDKQVPPKPNLEEIEKALESGVNEDYTVKELPGLNHLFQTAETGAESEYTKIEETISPVALELMSGWVLDRTRVKREE